MNGLIFRNQHRAYCSRSNTCVPLFVVTAIVLFYVVVMQNETKDPMEAKRRIPVQYVPSDVREFHIYNEHLLSPASTIHLTNTNHSTRKRAISVVKTFDPNMSVLYVVTPTYTRVVQKAELTNMCSVMKYVRNLVWIVIEDSEQKTQKVIDFLINCEIPTVHLNFKSHFEPQFTVDQRNAALEWIRENVNISAGKGVVYFADDDNTYDPQIFEQMRSTRRVSVWPVGLAAGIPVEKPLVEDGKVVDWVSGFDVKERKFPIDMAGFAFNVRLLHNNEKARFRHDVIPGHLETEFIDTLGVPQENLEPKADNCSQVLVWHTQTVVNDVNSGATKFGEKIPEELDF